MKKIFLSLLVLFAIIGMTGCKTKKGESFKVSLVKNSSARIDWDYKLSQEGIVDVSYSYDNSKCESNASGCGGTAIYTITALKPGKVELTFECAGICEPLKNTVYEITVNDDLSISETHSEVEEN